jgi:hypothetical protein
MTFDDGIVQTTNVPDEARREFLEDMRTCFPNLRDNGQVLQFSQDPPSWVELVASLATWKSVFGVGAAAFLVAYAKKSGEMAAQATPNKIRALCACVRRLSERLGRSATAIVKIPGPGSYFTRLVLRGDDPELNLARFIKHLDAITAATNGLRADDLGGEVTVRVDDASFTLEWLSASKNRAYHRSFDTEGKPLTESGGVLFSVEI